MASRGTAHVPVFVRALLVAASLSQVVAAGVTFPNRMMTESVPAAGGVCSAPSPTTTFWSTDTYAVLWFIVDGANAGDQPVAQWYAPDGSLQATTQLDSPPSAGNWCYATWIPIAGSAAASLPGSWTASLYWNGAPAFSQPFTITAVSLSVGGSMPQLASAGGWDTTLTLLNLGSSPAQASLSFFGDDGSPLTLPLTFPIDPAQAPGATQVLDETLQPNAVLVVDTTGPASQAVSVGWAQLLTGGDTSGFAIFKYQPSGQEAVVPLETRNADSYLLAFDNTGALATGLAVANAASQAASIPVIVRDDSGAQIGTDSISLAVMGHTSFMLADQEPSTAGKRGTVEFDTPAGGRIGLIGLRANGAALTTLPVLADGDTPGGRMAQVAAGGGWETTFTLVNTGALPAQAVLSFFDDNGDPLALFLTMLQTGAVQQVSTLNQTIQPGGTLVVNTSGNGLPNAVVGSAQLAAYGSVGGFAIFRYDPTGQEAVVPLDARNAGAYALAFDNSAGLATGLALANSSYQAITVPVFLRDHTGAVLGLSSISLPPSGHTSFMLTDAFAPAADSAGTIEFDAPAGVQISALGLRATPTGALTTIPTLAATSTSASLVPQGSVMLNVQTSGDATGIIVASPPGPVYPAGTVVTLSPVPGANSTFMGWSGACSGMGPCTVTVNSSGTTARDSAHPAGMANPSVSLNATFTRAVGGGYTLLVRTTPTGGTVTPTTPGTPCGANCWVYQPNAKVTLQANPATGFTFAGWSGACAGMTCVLRMTANFVATATFTQGAPSGLVFSPVQPPSGTVGVAYPSFSFCDPPTDGVCGESSTANPKGGVPPYNFYVGTGAFPPMGLSVNTNGTVTGIPVTAGTTTFPVCVADTAGNEKCQNVTITINPGQPLVFNPVQPPDGTVGVAYSFSFCTPAAAGTCGATQTTNPTGGVAPYTFTITNGQLPPPLTLASNGTVSGTPTVAGNSPFSICVTDYLFHQQCQNVAITIHAGLGLNSLTLSPNTVTGGGSVTGTVTLSGGATAATMGHVRAAAAGDTIVMLESDNAAAQVPASVTVPAGQTSATFTVTTSAVSVQTAATITATLGDTVKTASLTVLPANALFTLTISEAGTGSGTVVSSPSGINCPGTCSWNYPSGTQVTLTASAATGSTFDGWSGACSGTGTCPVTMGGDQSVTATFDSSGPPTSGSVTPSTLPLGTVGGCDGGQVSGSFQVTAPSSMTWRVDLGDVDPTVTVSPLSGTGNGAINVTVTEAPQTPTPGFTCSDTSSFDDGIILYIWFDDLPGPTVNATWIYVSVM